MTRRENFPVASMLVRPDARPLMRAFYAYARAADDVADDPQLAPEAKLRTLDGFEAGLDGDPAGAPEALALKSALAAADRHGAARHARALLGAFRQDATVGRTPDWEALMAYCRMSADPVGRFILDIHDEPPQTHAPSDALCTALQVLNHLQDLRSDYERLDRVYLPLDRISAARADVADLSASSLTPALRGVVDETLGRTDELLDVAQALPRLIGSRRLAAEVRAILTLARILRGQLGRGDPLARRIRPGRRHFAAAAGLGLCEVLRTRTAGPSIPERRSA